MVQKKMARDRSVPRGPGKGAEVLPTTLVKARAMLAKARELNNANDYSNALRVLDESLEMMQQVEAGPEDMAPVLSELSRVHVLQGNLDKGEAFSLKAMGLVSRPGMDASVKGEVIGIHGLLLNVQGDLDGSLRHAVRALALLESADNKQGIANVCNTIGNSYYTKFLFGKAQVYYLRALKMNKELGNRRYMYGNMLNIALTKGESGFYDDGIKRMEEVLGGAMEVGERRLKGYCHANIGNFSIRTGGYERALSEFDTALDIAEKVGDNKLRSSSIIGKVEALTRLGRFKEASSLMEANVKGLLTIKVWDLVGRALRVRGILNSERGELDKAFDDFKLAEGAFQRTGNESYLALNYIDWGKAVHKKGDIKKATELFDKTRHIYKVLRLSQLEKELARTMNELCIQ